MSETLPGQITIQERGDATRLRTTRPDTNAFGSVRHEERDRVAFAQTLGPHPSRIAVRVAVPLAIGEALAMRDEREIIAVLRCYILGNVAKGAIRIFHDRAAHFDGPPRAVEISQLAF